MAEINTTDPILSKDLRLKNINNIGEVENAEGFFHYTKESTAERILAGDKKHYFYLNPISKMNDLNEKELHKEDGDSVYALCFCSSATENIPMWYLYGGITGKGVRIGLTGPKMRDFINSISCVYAVENGEPGRILMPKLGYEMEYGWVFYRDTRERIKFRNKIYSLSDSLDDFHANNYFVKDYAWDYEGEFRILFHIKGKPPEKIAVPFDKELCMKKGGGLTVTMAPEARGSGLKVDKEPYASRFGLPEDKVRFSELGIQMDLIGRNRWSVIDNFAAVLDTLKQEETQNICNQMRAIKYCNPDSGNSGKEDEQSGTVGELVNV